MMHLLMNQLQKSITSLDLRTLLHQMLVNNLLGLAGDEDEMADEASVYSIAWIKILTLPNHALSLFDPKG
ncbi:MAG: hypothetical protein Q7U74_08760 [Saprospiraceae bacterium]|nr:hypothetical protein [Saprospiraceae bacterium]